jgi:catechol 2,3-dioxygenase-like lactoylglutathione lyase family enzyme
MEKTKAGGIVLERLDHLVLTVGDIEESCRFYQRVLGMRPERFGEDRHALHFGRQKINLHPWPSPIEPKAATPEPGTADLCLVATTPLEAVVAHLRDCGVTIEVGPCATVGAEGAMRSVYFRDPDSNLIEVSNYL